MALQELLKENPALRPVDDNKIRCSYSGHEMPSKFEAVRAYVDGKKYRTLLKQNTYDYESLLPYIVPSARRSHQLYCKLTRNYINKIPEHVARHQNGKKFKRALQKYENCSGKLWEEMPPGKRPSTHVSLDKPSKKMEGEEPGDDHQPVEDDIWMPSSGDEGGDSNENDDKDDKMDGNDNDGKNDGNGNDGESGMSDENVLDKNQDSDQGTFGIDDISKKVLRQEQSKEKRFKGNQSGENGTQIDKKTAWSSGGSLVEIRRRRKTKRKALKKNFVSSSNRFF